jgi:hypothetical protein
MAATPREQVVVLALATNCTFDVTVVPFAGLFTMTVANPGVAAVKLSIKRAKEKIFIKLTPKN